MRFGAVVMPDPPAEQVVEQARAAERGGFDYVWLYDSHLLFLDPYPLLGVLARETERVQLGTLVTNPVTRDPSVTASAAATLNLLSGGRAVIGIGLGDSACKVLGIAPANVERAARAIGVVGALASGRRVEWRGRDQELRWARGHVPLFVAALGPRMNEVAGRLADGVVVPVAEPTVVRWVVAHVRNAAERAGRDPDALVFAAGTPSVVSDDSAAACERVRFYPSMVANSAVALVERYGAAALPEALVQLACDRPGYDYRWHARTGAAQAAWVRDEVCESFCVIGNPAQVVARLTELEELGIRLWNLYLTTGNELETIDAYTRSVFPALR